MCFPRSSPLVYPAVCVCVCARAHVRGCVLARPAFASSNISLPHSRLTLSLSLSSISLVSLSLSLSLSLALSLSLVSLSLSLSSLCLVSHTPPPLPFCSRSLSRALSWSLLVLSAFSHMYSPPHTHVSSSSWSLSRSLSTLFSHEIGHAVIDFLGERVGVGRHPSGARGS